MISPKVVPGLTGVTALAAAGDHTCALGEAGAVWCWGRNQLGQLGIGTNEGQLCLPPDGREAACHLSPMRIEALDGSGGIFLGGGRSCVLTVEGKPLCWGGLDGNLPVGYTLAPQAGEGTCGDGTVDPGEDCDDGNQDPNDACTNQCVNNGIIPGFNGVRGPQFGGGWRQCAGYFDQAGGDQVPLAWGQPCALNGLNQIKVVCGANLTNYRYLDVNKNVFRDRLNAYPERNLIVGSGAAVNGQSANFQGWENVIYAQGNNPNTARSWWGGGNGCGEGNTNLTINNSCSWEASNCFGQNINGSRYLWVYVK